MPETILNMIAYLASGIRMGRKVESVAGVLVREVLRRLVPFRSLVKG